MLTSFAGLGAPPVVRAPAGAPVWTMVRAKSVDVNAPGVRWPQLPKPAGAKAEHSALDTHCTGRQGAPPHASHGVPMAHVHSAPDAEPLHRRANVFKGLCLQNPQNTFG